MTTRSRDVRRREIGGQDRLDRRLGAPPPSLITWALSLLRTRSVLGMTPSPTPAVVFLPLGALLGPLGAGLLSARVLERLDLAVTIALAVLGVLVGIAFGREIKNARRLFLAASLESFVTILVVATATAYFVTATGVPLGAPLAMLALALGLSASASSGTSADPDFEPAAAVATRVADLDDVLPIALGAVAFALLPAANMNRLWLATLAPAGIGVGVGVIGWLIFERAESTAERALFVLGCLALLGGAAAYVQVSPLATGLVAGLVWTVLPGRADRIAQDDLLKVQHPVVVLLLVAAGAMAVPSIASAWLLAPYLLCRLAGKTAGAWLSARLVDVGPADLSAYLMPPGVLAVAFALNFRQVIGGAGGDLLLSTVAIGTAAFELFALGVLPRWRRGAGA